jgi:hypothetical protein
VHEAPSEPITFTEGDEDEELVLPPFGVLDACPGCRSVKYEPLADLCENCRLNTDQLSGFRVAVEPITLYTKPSRLRDWLTFYKSEDERLEDREAVAAVAHILGRFIGANTEWLDDLAPDYLVVVPSTRRPPPHPLQIVVKTLDIGLEVNPVVQRTPVSLGSRAASAEAYEASGAAAALEIAGAQVVSLAVLGRRINPSYRPRAAELFEQQQSRHFEWSVPRRHSFEH